MPARGSYQITSREEGKAAQRDESYKSCILAMLIFFLLCIVIILASWPWNKWHTDHNYVEEDSKETGRVEGEGFSTVAYDPEIEIDRETRDPVKNGHFERYSNNESTKSHTILYTRTTEQDQKTREIGPELPETMQTFSTPDTTSEMDLAVSDVVRTNRSSLDEDLSSSTEAVSLSTVQTSSTFETTSELDSAFSAVTRTDRSTVEEDLSSFTEAVTPSSEQSNNETTEESSTPENNSTSIFAGIGDSTRQIETTRGPPADFTSLQRLLVGTYFGNETTTSSNEDSGDNWLDDVQAQTTREPDELMKSSESPELRSSSSNRFYPTVSVNSKITTTGSAGTEAKVESATLSSVGEKTSTSFQYIREQEINICETGSCKQLASKILSYMNHSVDPCDDFYEYACGGLEADPQINEIDLYKRVYKTIAIEARKKEEQPEYARFGTYYESCLKYEANFDKPRRIHLAKEALNKVGKFYTSVSWPGNFQGFTALFANMLLNNGPLLFDIVPDLNETNPGAFTLKIGPAINKSPFQFTNIHDVCEDESEEALHDQVDLGQLYENYKSCKKNTRSLVTSITHALKELAIFEDLDNPYNISQYLHGTTIDIDLEIIKGILPHYPPRSEILEAYKSKRYAVMTLGQLEADCKLLNWSELIFSLTGLTLGPNAQLQVYYKHELINAMQHLDQFGQNNGYELNNALLGLYARNLYQDLVASRWSSDLEKDCLYVATHFLEREASQLYMSSFTDNKLQNIKAVMEKLFHELKETLKIEIQRSEWAVEWGRQVLLKKLEDMRMSLPDSSYLKNTDLNRLIMTDNYFENSLTLMKKYRSTMYSVMQKNPNDPEQIWTFFASPFQSITQTIYAMNLIVIPLGAIDWPFSSRFGESFQYLVQAAAGNVIAREIAHNFDTNGIRYWNGSRDSEFAIMTDSDVTKTTFEEYIECQRNSLYQQPMEMSLPVTGQQVTFTIPPMTLNERLSDAVGMRLAHDTLARLDSIASEKRLPWLDLDISQLFYLAYAQTHCTKAPLTSSYVSLHEDQTLPSRIRIFVVASNNKLLGEAWRCPEGSQILPTFSCGVFPHLEYHSDAPDAA